jgi:hypothetical protein
MNPPQPDLFAAPRHPENADVAWLENHLKGNPGWHTSRELIGFLLKPATDDNRRWIRELASKSKWVISGQKGYQHLEHSTPEEINHAAHWLESQAKQMSERAGAIRSNAHKIFGR